jgi:hypothetical protein
MKKTLRILSVLSIATSSILFVPPASAIGTLYNGTSGDVACTSGFFTVLNNEVTSNSSCTGAATIPSGVTSIGNSAFYGASGITSLTIPNSVTSIGMYAFAGLTSLTSLAIPNSITSISLYSFVSLRSLTSLTIPNSVTSIGREAFNGATALTSLAIPSSVTSIDSLAFGSATSLTSLVIPNSVTSLGDGAFYNVNALTSLTLGSGLTSIADDTFYGASALTSLTIPNSVTSIGDNAFANATSLTTLNLGTGLTTIADGSFILNSGAFSGATSLTSLTIPSNVTSIGRNAFRGATSLTSLTIPNSVTSIGANVFTGTTALTSYTYCGTSLTSTNLSSAGLGSKTPISCAPSISAPGTPTSVVATATGKRSATVSFAAPTSNGGSAVTSYTATSTPGGITKTLTQATGGTFTFEGLQPGTAYTFAVTATNAIGTSAAAISNSITTAPLVVALLSTLSFVDDGTGTGGKIVWSGKSIDAVLYTGSATYYPGPYNYGAFSSGWNGRIRNLTPGTEYTVSLFAVSADGIGESKTLTFKTSAALPAPAGAASATISRADEMTAQLPKLFAWIDENTFVEGEGDRMKMMLNKFDALVTSPHRSHIKVPTSRVLSVVATSQTPLACSVVSATAKESAGVVKALSGDTCTISYTVSGGSRAPVTMVKDFVFKKFAK